METFGPYALLEPVAAGGVGIIYRAKLRGAGGFEKIVAIKRIRPEISQNAERIQSLLDEARLAARLTHGHIVQIHNLELIDDEWAMVLEYVDGVDLARLLRSLAEHERRLGVDECVHIVKELLVALDYLHRISDDEGRPLGLVHCDLAPSNVMLNVGGEVKLCDFGMAKSEAHVALAGVPGGKLRYRAPEQARGLDFDLRVDIYAAGIILWELLAGERIYESLGAPAIAAAVEEGRVPPLEAFRPGLRPDLARVLSRALHADPRYRYPHAAAFLRALEDLELARDPARSRHVLAEIVSALRVAEQDRPLRATNPVLVAEDSGLEAALESALE